MQSLVLELQQQALDPAVPVSNLLRSALVVAVKLGLKDQEAWIRREQNGYESADVPNYRVLHGPYLCRNPGRGWMPVLVEGSNEQATDMHAVREGIAQVQHLVAESGDAVIVRSSEPAYSPITGLPFEQALHLQKASLVAIVEAVRNRTLDWALQLERDGIRGEGMTFTPQERAKAERHSVTYNSIVVNGPANVAQGTAAVQTTTNGIDAAGLESLINLLRDAAMQVSEAQRDEFDAQLATFEHATAATKPKFPVIRGLAESMRRVLEGALGKQAPDLFQQLRDFIASLPN